MTETTGKRRSGATRTRVPVSRRSRQPVTSLVHRHNPPRTSVGPATGHPIRDRAGNDSAPHTTSDSGRNGAVTDPAVLASAHLDDAQAAAIIEQATCESVGESLVLAGARRAETLLSAVRRMPDPARVAQVVAAFNQSSSPACEPSTVAKVMELPVSVQTVWRQKNSGRNHCSTQLARWLSSVCGESSAKWSMALGLLPGHTGGADSLIRAPLGHLHASRRLRRCVRSRQTGMSWASTTS